MISRFLTRLLTALLALSISAAAASISKMTAGMNKMPGYLTLYWDDGAGKLWLEVNRIDTEFLYLESLATGIGSNDIGLDRGQVGAERIVEFRRVGPKLLLVQPNYDYRAITPNDAERQAVRESFAESVLWGFRIESEEKGRVLVDATEFFLRDAHQVTDGLEASEQGSYQLDYSRSAVYLPRTKSFPENTEVEVTLTFIGKAEGGWIRSVAPAPEAVTVRQHHSFIKLPDPGFEPREFLPGSGYFGGGFRDYAAPLGEPIEKRYIARHRLEKKDPSAKLSEAVKPIVYYLDPGVPEPVRSALLDGARWWAGAFTAAGYKDAFQVKILPEDADPMDIRYNLIQWVHRSTRGWSYGNAVADPRTGEILKGKVSLGSLRVRQDYLIAEALLAPYEEGKPAPVAMKEMALARLRQLSAHEIGHTLGLAHNYIASAQGRTSIMDYPHPLVKLNDEGEIDLSDAYTAEIGEWEKVTIAYGYQDFPDGVDEAAALREILRGARERGLTFLSDADARPAGSAHPQGHLWDNGVNAVDELDRMMKVRAAALKRFSENNIQQGAPMSTLEEVLVPLYLVHRYQVEAAAKTLGGVSYTYALRGDGQTPLEPVSGKEQLRALQSLMATIHAGALTLDERILRLIPPRPPGYPRNRETFASRTGVTFDPVSAAESAAAHTIRLLLDPQRAARMEQLHARDVSAPGLGRVLSKLIGKTWQVVPLPGGLAGEIQQAVNGVALHEMISLAAEESAPWSVRALVRAQLRSLRTRLQSGNYSDRADAAMAVDEINRFLAEPSDFAPPQPVEPPPGQPIGGE